MHLTKYVAEKETGFDWPRNSGEMYIVMNENATKAWGEETITHRRRNRHGQPVTLVISELNKSGEVFRLALPRSVGAEAKGYQAEKCKLVELL